ncbi:MAG: HAMP domain-containing protein [Spirochaetaceae bacterium]|nr:MAG: HAMP domain-containing protein [Spirochaetaceae bacterium]
MTIRAKIVSVVLPLLIVALLIGGLSASFIATNAITRIAVEFFEFKATELEKYVDGQWRILVENDLAGREEMVRAAQAGIEVFARSIIRSDSELIFAVDASGAQVLASAEFELPAEVAAELLDIAAAEIRVLRSVRFGDDERVVTAFSFEPFGWSFFVTELRSAFYSDVDRIVAQTIWLVVIGSAMAVLLVFVVVRYLMRPLQRVVVAMREIIATSDLGARVPVFFNDEIGELSHTFNVMTSELEKAQGQIKRHAYEAVLSQKREQRIRQIFQKYVPQELIDRFFEHPESMLVGENRQIAVLFSDIRGFTTISEAMAPDRLVGALNRYFSVMVDTILDRGGVIDKYIGDAIMAIFGAPVAHEHDALGAVLAGLDMVAAVEPFNAEQRRIGEPEFKIGVGIDYGEVTVGNIGTDRKMDYTVIGDRVNVASRLEGLTKRFGQAVLFSEALVEQAAREVPTRLVGKVAVKGRLGGLAIYTAARDLSPDHRAGYDAHNDAMALFYARDFAAARTRFVEASRLLGGDPLADARADECRAYRTTAPPDAWDGVEVMETK